MKTLLLLLAIAPAALAQCETVSTLSCPMSVIGASLSTSDCAAFDGSRFDVWKFSGTSGQTITIEMSSTSFHPLLMLIDPSGKPVVQNDHVLTTSTDSRLTYTLGATGTWTVIANSVGTSGTGSYVLTADLGCPATGPKQRGARR